MSTTANPSRGVKSKARFEPSREFPVGIQSFTMPELAARWGCTEEELRELMEMEPRRLRAVGNRIPFDAVRKWEQNRVAAVSTRIFGKKIPAGRQCAAVTTPANGQTPRNRHGRPAGPKSTRKEPRR